MGVTKRGANWYVKWKDAGGRWRRKATTARTRQEAMSLWHSLAEQAQRQRDGLSPRPLNNGMTMAQLCDWWVANECPTLSKRRAGNQLDVHVKRQAFGGLPLLGVTPNELDTFFGARLKAGYKASTINQLRAWLRSIFNRARRAGLWVGENPVRLTSKLEQTPVVRPTLTADEVLVAIKHAHVEWKCFFALGAYLGLRKGEICGLRKVDYNQARGELFVGHSYKTPMTKTKRTDTLPVPDVLKPYLDEALKTKGVWLCPRVDGTQRGEYCAPEDNLRSSMRRGGLTTGEWTHKCRRCVRKPDVAHVWTYPDDEKRKCPQCGFILWPRAVARPLRFHDLRHTCATLLLRANVPMHVVMRILRHSVITTTVNTYGHLQTEDLRAEMNRANAGPQPVQPLRVVNSTPTN